MKIVAVTETKAASVAEFRAKHPQADILEVDGRTVADVCESCGKLLFEGDLCGGPDSDGVTLCTEHATEEGWPVHKLGATK